MLKPVLVRQGHAVRETEQLNVRGRLDVRSIVQLRRQIIKRAKAGG